MKQSEQSKKCKLQYSSCLMVIFLNMLMICLHNGVEWGGGCGGVEQFIDKSFKKQPHHVHFIQYMYKYMTQ